MWHGGRRFGPRFRAFRYGFPPMGFYFSTRWGFPRRGEYLRMLEEYKAELEEELREVEQEIRELRGETPPQEPKEG